MAQQSAGQGGWRVCRISPFIAEMDCKKQRRQMETTFSKSQMNSLTEQLTTEQTLHNRDLRAKASSPVHFPSVIQPGRRPKGRAICRPLMGRNPTPCPRKEDHTRHARPHSLYLQNTSFQPPPPPPPIRTCCSITQPTRQPHNAGAKCSSTNSANTQLDSQPRPPLSPNPNPQTCVPHHAKFAPP